MIHTITVGMDLCEQLISCKNEHEFFDSRFVGDKRYKIRCLTGCGNCSRDFYICSVGNIEFDLTVIRTSIRKNDYVAYVPSEFILSSKHFTTRHFYNWNKNYE